VNPDELRDLQQRGRFIPDDLFLDLLDRYGFLMAFETIASSELVSVPIDSGGFLGS
jgi:hypothetical protein